MNKQALISGVTSARMQGDFRRDLDIKLPPKYEHKPKGMSSEALSARNITSYGKPNRPTTPAKKVVEGQFYMINPNVNKVDNMNDYFVSYLIDCLS